MARLLHAYLAPDRLPDRAALQAALVAQKLGVKIDGDWPPSAAASYLPFTLQGEDAGVYIGLQTGATLPDTALAAEPAGRSLCLSLRWGGDVREQIAALVVATALAEACGALVIDPETGATQGLSALQAKARTLVEENF